MTMTREKWSTQRKPCSSTSVMDHKPHVVCTGIKHWLQW